MSLQHKVTHRVLPNGISLIMVPIQGTGAVTAMVYMGVGSRHEDDSQQGLAHFTEHMLFKGGDRYKSTQEISKALDGVGGDFNAFTSHEYTAYYTKVSSDQLGLGLDILSDMVINAKFPADELEKEKGVIVEEINMYEDMPMRMVDQVLMDLLFGDTPLGRPIIGTKKSVTAFTDEDFKKYRDHFYVGGACTVAIAGSLDEAAAEKLVARYFGSLPAGDPRTPQPATFVREGSRVKILEKPSEQTHLMLSAEAYPFGDGRRHALRLLATMLGGNMSSRLFLKVREEQGLCYYVRANTDLYKDCGFLVASAGVDNSRLDKAVEAIVRQMKEIRDGAISQDELDRAKRYVTGKTLLAMEDSENVAEYYGSLDRMVGTQDTPAQLLAQLEVVTVDDVHAVARDIFTNDKLRLAVIGPKHSVAKLEGLLSLD